MTSPEQLLGLLLNIAFLKSSNKFANEVPEKFIDFMPW